jgi:RsiW-degrading membrane proteinase PrsW (M82 family)
VTAQQGTYDGAPAPRWGYNTGFFQRRQPAFWLFVLTLVITGLDALAQQLQMIQAVPGAWFTTVLLLLPYAIPVIAIIYLLDLYEREPVSILLAALLWGGIAATTLSMYTNTPLAELIFKVTGDARFTSDWSAALTAPFVEEGFKALGVILLVSLARAEMDDILDGFVWGAMVGIGFLLVEDVFYFVRAFAETGSYDGLVGMFLIRILGAGPYSHFLYTGLTGMGIAYYVTRTDQAWTRRLLVGLAFAAAGVGAHFFWNSPLLAEVLGDGGFLAWAMFVTVKGLPMLIGLLLVVRLARRRERRWFASFSQAFYDDGAITEREVADLGGLRSRRRARKAAGRAKGSAGEKLWGQVQRQQIGLAVAMSKFGSEQHPEVARQQGVVMGLKAQFAALGSASVMAAVPAWGQPAVPVQPALAQPIPVTVPAAAVAQPTPAGWGQHMQPSQPAPMSEPAAAPAPTPAPPPAWTPSHRAPDEGLAAWAAPDPSQPPIVSLAGRLELVVVDRAGDWARVIAINGWTGWVDARRLVPHA